MLSVGKASGSGTEEALGYGIVFHAFQGNETTLDDLGLQGTNIGAIPIASGALDHAGVSREGGVPPSFQ